MRDTTTSVPGRVIHKCNLVASKPGPLHCIGEPWGRNGRTLACRHRLKEKKMKKMVKHKYQQLPKQTPFEGVL